MKFCIADTFTDSLARLTGEEQKAVKTAAFDVQLNPSSPSMVFHELAKAKDKNFWSVRIGSDIRLIVHKSGASPLLCYVAHHDLLVPLNRRLLPDQYSRAQPIAAARGATPHWICAAAAACSTSRH